MEVLFPTWIKDSKKRKVFEWIKKTYPVGELRKLAADFAVFECDNMVTIPSKPESVLWK